LIGWLTNSITSNELQQQVSQNVTDVALTVANQINKALLTQVQLLEPLTTMRPIREQVLAANVAYAGTEQEIRTQLLVLNDAWRIAVDEDALIINVVTNNEGINFAANQLRSFAASLDAQSDLMITDRHGGLVAATRRVPDYFQADKPWWKAAWNNGQGAVFVGEPEIHAETGRRVMTIAMPIEEDDTVIGILHATLDIEILNEILVINMFGLEQQGRVVVVDREGAIIFDPSLPGDLIGAQTPVDLQTSGVLVDQLPGAVQTRGLNMVPGTAFHGYAKAPQQTGIPALDTLDWTTLSILPSTAAFAPINTAIRWQSVLVGLCLMVIFIALVIFIRRITRQIVVMSTTFELLNRGDYAARAPIISQDELGQAAHSLNTVLDNTLDLVQSQEERDLLQRSIMKLLEEVSDVAEGDLTVEAEVTSEVTGAIADSFNYMISQLRQIISNVQETIMWVTASARDIQQNTEKLALSSETQARQIGGASIEIQNMAMSMRRVSESATESVQVAQDARKTAKLGTLAVQDTIKGMRRIQEQVEETSKRITRLGTSSYEIGEIVLVINDIADRTSILALNASIQAASAGEAGRGFAVVASEVEELATQAAQATQQISGIIKTVQTEIEETITAMDESAKEVDIGTKLSDQAGRTLSEIDRVSVSLTDLIQAISRSAEHQAEATEGVASSMDKIANLTQRTADGTRQTAQSIDNLTKLTDGLRHSVSAFVLPTAKQNGHVPHK
ncbi:MAG: methyl-accepting chemotaxis protein, partial [Chloroflexota bacterium]